MNEKERIIELVKQNIISMDEALDLLEAASNSDKVSNENEGIHEENVNNETETDETNQQEEKFDWDDFNRSFDDMFREGKHFAKNFGDYISNKMDSKEGVRPSHETHEDERKKVEQEKIRKAELVQVEAELRDAREEFDRRHEQLTICNQRLREIEIFEELDGLTEEMETQKISLEDKKVQIEDKLNQVQEKMNALTDKKHHLGGGHKHPKTDFKNIFNTNTEKISEAASQIGKEAKREGKKWGSIFSEKSKSFLDNFNVKDFDVSIQVPWIKTSKEEFEWTFDAESMDAVMIDSFNGSVELEAYDGAEVIVHSDTRFHGNFETTTKEVFLESNTLEVIDNQLIIKLNSPKISADLYIKVPKKQYKSLHFSLLNGDINLMDIEADTISLKNKNGDAYFKNVTANETMVDFLNGDIELIDSPIETIVINNLNGDTRINGYINNLSAEALNSDFLLTKHNVSDANIKVKTVSGDIKLSLPEHLNLTIESKTTHGTIKNRLTNLETIDDNESNNKGRYHRIVADQTQNATVNITSTSGDIYLKDSKNQV